MIKRILLPIFCFLILSCEKNESSDLLTKGTWKLDNGLSSNKNESITFKSDNTYVIEANVQLTENTEYKSGTITGGWSRKNDEIQFVSSDIHISENTNSINIIPASTGTPIGMMYGIVDFNSSGFIHYSDTNNVVIFYYESMELKKWTIVNLTNDSLIVDSEGKLLKYYKE